MESPNFDSSAEIERCLRGDKLYGDDFPAPEIEAWFRDEEKGYYNLGAKDRDRYVYAYHALNWIHGYSALPNVKFRHILGMGSAYGDELWPVARKASMITILEPSDGFEVQAIEGVSVQYVKPSPSGCMPFRDSTFDLITCLGVLHHVPNVGTVIREIYRCLSLGGYALVREPTVSMGDWRKPRKGLTKRERGIPLQILRGMIRGAGFEIRRERKCMFPITSRLRYLMRTPVFNSMICTFADLLVCGLPIWPRSYHPKNALAKLRPNSIFFVLRKG